MFTRTHRLGRHLYTEVLESYRDTETGKPRHRCIARWRAERSFAEELGRTRFAIDLANKNVAFWQGLIDGTQRPLFRGQSKRATENVRFWRRRLEKETSHFATLNEARDKGLPADDGEIERGVQLHANRSSALTTSANAAIGHPAPKPDLRELADRVRSLVVLNDPDMLGTNVAEI